MPAGLQLFDEHGNCIFDTPDSSMRVLGYVDTKAKDGKLFLKITEGCRLWATPIIEDARWTPHWTRGINKSGLHYSPSIDTAMATPETIDKFLAGTNAVLMWSYSGPSADWLYAQILFGEF